jgi:peptide/nickel transport system substrate-binding protein
MTRAGRRRGPRTGVVRESQSAADRFVLSARRKKGRKEMHRNRTVPAGFRIGAVASALAMGLAALPALQSGASAADQGPTLQNTTPEAKGTLDMLKWAAPFGEPPTLDPAKGADNSIYLINYNLCDTLVKLNPDYTKGPGLAESWEYSADHKTLTLKIRQGVKFSDGSPLTAEDVQFSLARHMDKKLASIYRSIVFPNVESVTVGGPDSVVVKFKQPDELFLSAMPTPAGLVLQKQFVEASGTAYGSPQKGQICTGAYKIDEWKPGSDVMLSANPYYWDAGNKPHAQHIDIRFISDNVALTQALLSGEIDGSYEIPPAAIAPLSAGSGKLYYGPSPQMFHIYAVAPGPMADPKMRQAFSMLIDREAIASKVYHGSAAPNYAMVPPLLWDASAKPALQAAYDKIKAGMKYDVAAAKKLIDEMPDKPSEITLVTLTGNEQMRLTATLIQQLAAEVGIDLKIKEILPAQNASYFFDANARKGVDLIMNQGYSTAPDELYYPSRVVMPDGVFNLVKYDNPEATKLLYDARAEFDAEKRAQTFVKAQEMYEPAKIIIPMAVIHEVTYLREGLTGAVTSYAYLFSSSLAKIGPN